MKTIEVREEIELLKATVSEIKLSSGFSLNDHTGSYITVLAGGGGGVATAAERAGDELNADALTNRITTAVREAGEDVTMRAVLLQLIDTAAFNLAFLTVTETAAAS
ncbi:uncharacterized protein BDCG_00279 [Blastomyces dermatitidis ER-3]|uniref:Uncharacterized protein n=1 Tax=Ajellomyces dermatitidis (strain ER-3 / ATCC MYA-2586) TaxID=559297 RepID=A0ABP2EK38_AJEDR|nr:uncharacterized protein BDCG_00279 [Blastomyces dermatitidis ER-3]EEQ83474.2 hypothetical protein BDCG_00279 [Blastomyces dermatitidis ER-3]